MADNVVPNVAEVAEKLARDLWVTEYGDSPKASDIRFFALLAACTKTLQGAYNPENARTWAENALK